MRDKIATILLDMNKNESNKIMLYGGVMVLDIRRIRTQPLDALGGMRCSN